MSDRPDQEQVCSICGDKVKIDAHGRATCFTCGKFVTVKKPSDKQATQPKLFNTAEYQ